MALISLLVCSRISGNKNFGLPNLLESLKEKSSNYENFEVLIKFDSDDKEVNRILPELNAYPFKIKYLIEPRGRGYVDLHVFYNRLFSQADERSVVIGAMADDFEIAQKGWDEVILSKLNVFADQIFTIHTAWESPYSTKYPEAKDERFYVERLYLNFDMDDLENVAIEAAPFWSKGLLKICGGFGHVSFTDAWTLVLEHLLFHRFGIIRTIFFEKPIITRRINYVVDTAVALRWQTERAENFAFMKRPFYKTLVEQQALNIYCNIKMFELSALLPRLLERSSESMGATVIKNGPRPLGPQPLYAYFGKYLLKIYRIFARPPLIRRIIRKLYWKLYYKLHSVKEAIERKGVPQNLNEGGR